jgi:hypothetical protein
MKIRFSTLSILLTAVLFMTGCLFGGSGGRSGPSSASGVKTSCTGKQISFAGTCHDPCPTGQQLGYTDTTKKTVGCNVASQNKYFMFSDSDLSTKATSPLINSGATANVVTNSDDVLFIKSTNPTGMSLVINHITGPYVWNIDGYIAVMPFSKDPAQNDDYFTEENSGTDTSDLKKTAKIVDIECSIIDGTWTSTNNSYFHYPWYYYNTSDSVMPDVKNKNICVGAGIDNPGCNAHPDFVGGCCPSPPQPVYNGLKFFDEDVQVYGGYACLVTATWTN